MALTELWRSRVRQRHQRFKRGIILNGCSTGELDTVEPALGTLWPADEDTEGTGASYYGEPGRTVHYAGASFQLAGVTQGDTIVFTGSTGPTDGAYSIASVDSETVLTLNASAGGTGTMSYSIGSFDAMKLVENKLIPNNPRRKGEGLIISLYEQGTKWKAATRTVGRAVLLADIGVDWVNAKKDVSGNIIQGPVFSAGGTATGEYYKVVKGSATLPKARHQFSIITAYNSFNASTLMDKAGKVNNAALSGIGSGADAGTVLLLGARRRKVWGPEELDQLHYMFSYNDDGWNGQESNGGIGNTTTDALRVQMYTNVPVRMLTWDTAGDTAKDIHGDPKYSVVMRPKIGATVESRQGFKTTGFTDINGYLEWEP